MKNHIDNCDGPIGGDCSCGFRELSKETILNAALRNENQVVFTMPRPNRHHSIINAMFYSEIEKRNQKEQGFMTSEGRFVNRTEAMVIALESGQLTKKTGFDYLFSEDLW